MSPPSPSPARTSHAGGEPFACAPGAGDEPLGVRCRRADGKLPGRSGCAGGQPFRACAKCANFHRQLSLSPLFLLPQRPASPNPHCSTRASPARWRATAAQPCGGDRSEAWPPCISSSRQHHAKRQVKGATGGEDGVGGFLARLAALEPSVVRHAPAEEQRREGDERGEGPGERDHEHRGSAAGARRV